MAVIVLVAAMGVTVKVLAWTAHERRGADRRAWALQTASNVLERVSAEPFDRVTTERVQKIVDATDAGRVLPGAGWEVEVIDEPGSTVLARRVSLRLRWNDRTGRHDGPLRLTAWVYRRKDRDAS